MSRVLGVNFLSIFDKFIKFNKPFNCSFIKTNKRSFLFKTKANNDEKVLLDANNKEGIKVSFYSKAQVSKDGYVLRFLLPDSESMAGFKTCQYVFLEGTPNSSQGIVKRPYHPISLDTDKGFVDILIKVYEKSDCNLSYGIFSNYLANLQEGEVLKMTGPYGNIQYNGYGEFLLRKLEDNSVITKKVTKIGMIAGGTGISPMFQLIQKIFATKNDYTGLSLIYCTKLIEEMSFSEDLIKFDSSGKLSFYPVAENPETTKWIYGKGRVNEEMIENFMPSPNDKNSLIFLCGPRLMLQDHVIPLLKSMSYPEENILYY